MRQYDDEVEVRREGEAPDQFLWRGRLWKVRSVVVRWVETGAWWSSAPVRAVLGDAETVSAAGRGRGAGVDLLEERVVWRVEAASPGRSPGGAGTFDLVHEVALGRWRLVGCTD